MKNIVTGFVAHVDAGKTTLSESLLYITHTTRHQGRVDHKDTLLDGSLTVVSNFSLTKSLKTLIISILLSFFIVKFVKIFVLIWANMCYNRHRR